jgi:hypothetical protein
VCVCARAQVDFIQFLKLNAQAKLKYKIIGVMHRGLLEYDITSS